MITGIWRGWIAVRPRKPQRAAGAAGRLEAGLVAEVGPHRLHRRWQSGRASGDDDPGPDPLQRLVGGDAEVAAKVGLAERDRRDRRMSGDLVRGLDADRGLDQGAHLDRAAELRPGPRRCPPATRPSAAGCGWRPNRSARRSAARSSVPGAFTRTSASCDRSHSTTAVARGRTIPGRDRVLEVDDHPVGTGSRGLVEPVRPVCRHVERGEDHTTPSGAQVARSRRRPGRASASTASVSAPCGRPGQRTPPGVSDSRATRFCIFTGPSTS